MPILSRHPFAVAIVTLALVVTTGVFALARPTFHRTYESEMIDFASKRHHSPAEVRRAFRAHGVTLAYTTRFAGMTTFSNDRLFRADSLQVIVGPRTGKGSFGPELEPYDVRFDNVLITYGGDDARLLDRVRGAVMALR